MSNNISRTKELEEFKKILSIEPKTLAPIKVAIINDGKQFSIRIPKKFADIMHLDKDKDQFEFTVTIPLSYKEQPELAGRVIKG